MKWWCRAVDARGDVACGHREAVIGGYLGLLERAREGGVVRWIWGG